MRTCKTLNFCKKNKTLHDTTLGRAQGEENDEGEGRKS